MKIAIIGAGFAGIVCATQLEKLGIMPDIYELNSDAAEPYRHVGASLQIVSRPIKDPLVFLEQNYGISLKPSGLVKKVIHKSPFAGTTISGNLGYFLYRGAEPDSIDNQLAKNLKTKILFNTKVDYRELCKTYDYVIVASGFPFEAKESGIWQDVIKMSIKGAVIRGDFSTDTFIVWLNKKYCNSGYAYLAPFSDKQATLALAVSGIEIDEVDKYWDDFIKTEKINYDIIETFKRVHYSGLVYPHKVDNIYFIGNAGGALDSLLGFGVFSSVVTASAAAKSIVEGMDYELQVNYVFDLNKKLLEFRKVLNKLDNKKYDLLIKALGLPGVNSIIYNTNINAVSIGNSILNAYNELSDIGSNLKYFSKKYF